MPRKKFHKQQGFKLRDLLGEKKVQELYALVIK